MEVRRLAIEDVILITPGRHSDKRGFFSETFNKFQLATEAGITEEFVQDNHSLSVDVGTVRGMHFQVPPVAQDKLVRVLRGSVLDVVVDIRRGSPSYGRSVSAVLSEEKLGTAMGAQGLRSWPLHAGTEHRGGLQGNRVLLGRA